MTDNYYLINKYNYCYTDELTSEFVCNVNDIKKHIVDIEGLMFLAKHYVKTYTGDVFRLELNTIINNINYTTIIIYSKNYGPCFEIYINYCLVEVKVLHFCLDIHKESKNITILNSIFNLLYFGI